MHDLYLREILLTVFRNDKSIWDSKIGKETQIQVFLINILNGLALIFF